MHKHIHAGAHEQCIRIRHAPVWSGWDACVLQVWAQVCAKAVLSLCHILSWWGRRQRLRLRSAVYAQQSCLVLATLTINIGLVDVCEGKQLHFYCALLISDIPTHTRWKKAAGNGCVLTVYHSGCNVQTKQCFTMCQHLLPLVYCMPLLLWMFFHFSFLTDFRHTALFW